MLLHHPDDGGMRNLLELRARLQEDLAGWGWAAAAQTRVQPGDGALAHDLWLRGCLGRHSWSQFRSANASAGFSALCGSALSWLTSGSNRQASSLGLPACLLALPSTCPEPAVWTRVCGRVSWPGQAQDLQNHFQIDPASSC